MRIKACELSYEWKDDKPGLLDAKLTSGNNKRPKFYHGKLVQLDENDFEIPEYMLENEIKSITSQYESMQQKIDESIKTELSLIAKKRVRLNLIYMKITEDNKLSVSEKDVSEFIAKSDPASQQQILEKKQSDKD